MVTSLRQILRLAEGPATNRWVVQEALEAKDAVSTVGIVVVAW